MSIDVTSLLSKEQPVTQQDVREPLDIAGIRARCEDAKRCSWGVYNVHPYLENLSAALDRIEELEAQLASKPPSPDIAGITELVEAAEVESFRFGGVAAAHNIDADEATQEFVDQERSRTQTREALLSSVSKILEERDEAAKNLVFAREWIKKEREMKVALNEATKLAGKIAIETVADLRAQLASSVERLKEMEAALREIAGTFGRALCEGCEGNGDLSCHGLDDLCGMCNGTGRIEDALSDRLASLGVREP